jgi:peptidoglycan/LPS O-acetylase OafA/YrhL
MADAMSEQSTAVVGDFETPRLAPSRTRQVSVSARGSIPVLDGWRGISILSVLACHMLPLGPKWMQLNACAGPVGMSLFFCLSGFLITSTLLDRMDILAFFIRRACRILPLAYLFSCLVLVWLGSGPMYFVSHALFTINYDHAHMSNLTGHFWSLCVEVHFYLFIGLLIGILGRKGFAVLPIVCLAITGLRIAKGVHISIVTHFRADEILAGACLALAYQGYFAAALCKKSLGRIPQLILAGMLLLSSHPAMGPLNYLRPYCAAALVGSTLFRPENRLSGWLCSGLLKYVAKISYALYVIHPVTYFGWLQTGGPLLKYIFKRPISFALTFGLAHLSTHYFEQRWMDWGKAMARRPRASSPVRV